MQKVTDLDEYRASKKEAAIQQTVEVCEALKRSAIHDLLQKPFVELTEDERQRIVRWLHVSAAYKECERNALSDLLRGDA